MKRSFKLIKRGIYIVLTICFILLIDIIQPLAAMSTEVISPLFQRALEQTEKGQFSEALHNWDEFLASSPHDVVAITLRGNCLLALGEAEPAILAQSYALELSPSNVEAHLYRGNAEESLHKWDAAAQDYQWILDRYPNETSALYNLGNVMIAKSNWKIAEASFSKAVSVKPDFVMAMSNQALVKYQLEKLDESESELRMLIRRYPMFADARAALSALLWRKGSYGEAESHWIAAKGLDNRYIDREWLLNVRRWPSIPTNDLMTFLELKHL